MLGLKRLVANFVYTATPNVFTPLLNAVTGENLLGIGFQVEEDEMFVHLYARVLMDVSVDDTVNLTFFVDGADVETIGVAGLVQKPLAALSAPETLVVEKTIRLDKGFHTVDFRMLTAGVAIPTIGGSVIPAELEVRRSSHPATLGHGVDSKSQLLQ